MNNLPALHKRLAEFLGVLKQLENGILEEKINPLYLPFILANFDKWIKYAKENKNLQDCVKKKFEDEKTIDFNGVKITQTERATWDYSVCEDERLNALNEQIKYLTEQKKAVEEELQARYRINDFVNPITGEIVEIVKPIKTTKSFFTVKM